MSGLRKRLNGKNEYEESPLHMKHPGGVRTRLNSLIKTVLRESENRDISYMALRQVIGFLGVLLAFVNFFVGFFFAGLPLLDCISLYYFTNTRDILVGVLFVVGFFLITYRGETYKENLVTVLTGVSALGVALFPCRNDSDPGALVGFLRLDQSLSNDIHFWSAVVFFVSLSAISIILFSKSKRKYHIIVNLSSRSIFLTSGIIMLLALLGLFLCNSFFTEAVKGTPIVYVLESVGLITFGVSWLLAGHVIKQEKKAA